MQALTVNTDANGLGGSFNQVFTLSDADVTLAKNSGLYINIHTPTNPSGELRGQIILDTVPTAENTTAVTTVSANDLDVGTTLSYSISGTDAALFNINSSTGAIAFKTVPNFEVPTDNGANNRPVGK